MLFFPKYKIKNRDAEIIEKITDKIDTTHSGVYPKNEELIDGDLSVDNDTILNNP